MTVRTWMLLVGGCLLTAAPLSAQQDESKDAKPKMSEEQQAQFDAWMATATPGPEHKYLGYMVGEWDAHVKHWMEPGAEAAQEEGWCKNEPILGGRFIRTEFKGTMMDMPFQGMGWTGYDRVQKKYINTWADTFGTMLMVQDGSYDEAEKEFTYQGSYEMEPGQTIKSKTTIKVLGPNKHVMLMYQAMPGQDEMSKILEITYERVKKGEEGSK